MYNYSDMSKTEVIFTSTCGIFFKFKETLISLCGNTVLRGPATAIAK